MIKSKARQINQAMRWPWAMPACTTIILGYILQDGQFGPDLFLIKYQQQQPPFHQSMHQLPGPRWAGRSLGFGWGWKQLVTGDERASEPKGPCDARSDLFRGKLQEPHRNNYVEARFDEGEQPLVGLLQLHPILLVLVQLLVLEVLL